MMLALRNESGFDRLSQPLVACVSWCVVAALEEEPCFASTVSENPVFIRLF